MEEIKSEADKIVEELKQMNWENIYDNETVNFSKAMPKVKEQENDYYTHLWCMKHIDKGAKHLDVGCSYGRFPFILKKEKDCIITGVDVSRVAIDMAKAEMPDMEFIQTFGESLPFPNESFDSVSSCQTLEHMKYPEVSIKEMLRVLKKGGKLLVTVPIEKMLDGVHGTHIHNWDYYGVMELFDKFGDNYKIHWINKFNYDLEPGWKSSNNQKPVKNVWAIKFVKE